ncbi:hypothetical protein AAY473_014440 [Plecturocebus cupreus]
MASAGFVIACTDARGPGCPGLPLGLRHAESPPAPCSAGFTEFALILIETPDPVVAAFGTEDPGNTISHMPIATGATRLLLASLCLQQGAGQRKQEATPLSTDIVDKLRRGGGAGVTSAEALQAGWAGHMVGAPETRPRKENRSSKDASVALALAGAGELPGNRGAPDGSGCSERTSLWAARLSAPSLPSSFLSMVATRILSHVFSLAGQLLQLTRLLLIEGLQLLAMRAEQAVLLLQGPLLPPQPVLIPAGAGELGLHLHLCSLEAAYFCSQFLDLSLQVLSGEKGKGIKDGSQANTIHPKADCTQGQAVTSHQEKTFHGFNLLKVRKMLPRQEILYKAAAVPYAYSVISMAYPFLKPELRFTHTVQERQELLGPGLKPVMQVPGSSNDSPASTSQVHGLTSAHHCSWLILVEMGYHHIGQADLKLLTSYTLDLQVKNKAKGLQGCSKCPAWGQRNALIFMFITPSSFRMKVT